VTVLPGLASSAPMNASNSSFALAVENVLDVIDESGLPTVPDAVASIARTPGGGAATVTVTAVDVVCLPDASRARAASVCDPSGVAVVFHAIEYGLVMTSAPRFAPSSLNWTPAMATLSDALADTVTAFPSTVEPLAGADIAIVGGVVSGVVIAVSVKYVSRSTGIVTT